MADAERAHDSRQLFRFGGGVVEGGAADAALLGGKGANLAEMAAIGLPVPPGFTLPVATATHIEGADHDAIADSLIAGIAYIETATGKRFGDPANPLLVSVRSGAGVSMPGMMDTVLNLGLNDAIVAAVARDGDARFAWDGYRRLVQGYGSVVFGLDGAHFQEALEIAKEDRGLALDSEMTAEDWRALVDDYRAILADGGGDLPQDVWAQLRGAVAAVAASWWSDRAAVYRRLHGIGDEAGTAVTVQAMVFGNRGAGSATGVAFTRDPASGERVLFGEFLPDAQGEDLVAGVRTPRYLTHAARKRAGARAPSMQEAMPVAYGELAIVVAALERHWRDMQDVEFTIEQGRLWLLQTRTGKRTGRAAIRMAVDMANEGLITRAEALLRVDPTAIEELSRPVLDPDAPGDVIARGLPASPGAATGEAVFDAATAVAQATMGRAVILIRAETSPEDIAGMHAARGIVTARGGMTSHAAVVARGLGRPCITGVSDMRVDATAKSARRGDRLICEGDLVTIDGTTGAVMLGEVATVQPALDADAATLLGWADDVRGRDVDGDTVPPGARLAAAQAIVAACHG